ncbi:phosphonoacetate hydrolase [Bradyrhizobium sp. 26S5]|uniref:phosphonoacetate hydrolase n=1 Tax=Bradyrhizobium sp. 26S5 TaxID=3139729 RepID=UPI0030CE7691
MVAAPKTELEAKTVTVNGREYSLPTRPTVIVCLDGFDPDYLSHGISTGLLPTMKKFKESGFVGHVAATMPSTTNTNNTSIITGVPPAIHGINGNFYLDTETGEEIMITDAKRLRSETILGGLSSAGVSTVVATAKDKLLQVLTYKMVGGIGFSSENADKANMKSNGIDNVEKLVGRQKPSQYSADLSLFAFDAALAIFEQRRPAITYISTSDFIQHQFGPGEPEADKFHSDVDARLASFVRMGATVGLTADHGMSDKCDSKGQPNVVYLEDKLNDRFGPGSVRVICPIADPFVKHHGALGSFVRVHLLKDGTVSEMIDYVRTLPGIQLALDRKEVSERFNLPFDREGDFAAFSNRDTVVGARTIDHDLSQLNNHHLRSHGGLGEQTVPFMFSKPLKRDFERRVEDGMVHNYDIFDFALNGLK